MVRRGCYPSVANKASDLVRIPNFVKETNHEFIGELEQETSVKG